MRKLSFKVLILISFILLIESCDKNSSEPDSNKIIFEGITTTDIFGSYTGFYDYTDWQQNDFWQSKEKQLFTDYELYDTNCPTDTINQIVGYPNPIVDFRFKLHFVKDSTTRVDFRIVNQNFEKLISLDSVYSHQITLTFKDIVTENDSIYRVYYRFITDNNCEFVGHGDIQIK